MNRNLNRGPWESMEREWAKLLETHDVHVEIGVVYPGNSSSLRLDSFIVQTTVINRDTGEKFFDVQRFLNQEGETFDSIIKKITS